MNQGLSKSAIKPSSKNMLKDPSYRNPPVKRKRADETFQRFVLPKITPSYDLNSKKISSLANPTKNVHPMHGMPLNTSKLSVQSKTTVPTPTHSTKKEMYRISLSTKTTVEKTNNFGRSTDTSPLNCTPCTPKWQKPHNGESRDTPMSLNSIKKSLTRQDFEELVGFAKRFDTEKDNLLSNLNNLVQELSEKHNPLLEEGTEKLNTLEVEFDNKKCQQKEELDKLNYKIDSLKETQNSLSTMLEEKRERRLQVEQEKQGVEFSIRHYNESISKTKYHLSKLLKKNEDLNSFILNVEEAIKNTRSKVRTRYSEISCEEKKVLILKELVHDKKQGK